MNEIHRLASRARDGDQDALSDLVERLRSRLFAEAYSQLASYDDAQDAVASAIYQVCLRINDLRNPESVGAWMRTVVRNEAVKRRGSRDNLSALPDDLPGDAGDSGARLAAIDIRNALRRLPRDQARSLALFYLSGVSIQDIAQRMGRPAGTIKRWLHYGRRRLAEELEDYRPMETPRTQVDAAIISTELDSSVLSGMVEAIREAGFANVATLQAAPDLRREENSEGGAFHLPGQLNQARFIVLDEWIGGRSAFEIHAILKAAEESSHVYFGILLSSPVESTVFAAWAAGFELCLGKEGLSMDELRRFSKKILRGIQGES